MATTYVGTTPLEIAAPTSGNQTRIRLWLEDSGVPGTGKTSVLYSAVTCAYCKPGATAFVAFPTFDASNWLELGGGWYELILRQSDATELALLDTVGDMLFTVAATGCAAAQIVRRVVSASLPAVVWAYPRRTLTSLGVLATQLTAPVLRAIVGQSATIHTYYGDTVPINGTVLDGDAPYGMGTSILHMAVAASEDYTWAEAVFTLSSEGGDGITIGDPAGGGFTVALTDDQASLLPVGRYYWVLKLEDDAGVRRTLLHGIWDVQAVGDPVV